jgi:WD40 repeat protein
VWWQAQDEEGAHLRDQLKQAAHLWEEKDCSPDLLWSGTAFREFELWRERYPGKLTAVEEDYATAMVERVRRRRRLRRLAVAGVVAASLTVAAVVGVSRQQVAEEALRAEASKVLALAQARLQEDPTEALALTTASLELADPHEARRFVVRALWEAPPARELNSGNNFSAPELAFSPDGTRIAQAGWDTEVRVWTEDGEGPALLPGHKQMPGNKAEWASTNLLVTGPARMGSADARWAHVWSFPDGRRVRTIDFGNETWMQVGGERLLAGTLDSDPGEPRVFLLRSWRLPDGEPDVLGRVRVPAGGQPTVLEPGGGAWLYAKGPDIYRQPIPAARGRAEELLVRYEADAGVWYLPPLPSHPSELFTWDAASGDIRVWSASTRGLDLVRIFPRPETASEGFRIGPESTGQWLFNAQLHDVRQARLWSTASLPGARPLTLRRSGSWSFAGPAFHPRADWFVATTHATSHLTFWPLRKAYPIVVDGYSGLLRPVTFSHDGRWLATGWPGQGGEGSVRLWALPGTEPWGVRRLSGLVQYGPFRLVFDPKERFLFGVTGTYGLYVIPADGSPLRQFESPSPDREFSGLATSPDGRLVASASNNGQGARVLAVWQIDTAECRVFDLPEVPSTPEGFEGAVTSLHFADETTLYTAGVAGVLRWNLVEGVHETVFFAEPRIEVKMEMGMDGRTALARRHRIGDPWQTCDVLEVLDLESRARQPLASFGDCPLAFALDPSGTVAVTGDFDGVVRVGRLSGGEPHLLLGHEGAIDSVAISPDLRWVASSGEDNTLRLWPMPDLDKPPLHTLPHDELITKLESLTNLRAVRDPESPTGWTIELGPFPGWKDVPTW